jgi:hypothetical protein
MIKVRFMKAHSTQISSAVKEMRDEQRVKNENNGRDTKWDKKQNVTRTMVAGKENEKLCRTDISGIMLFPCLTCIGCRHLHDTLRHAFDTAN